MSFADSSFQNALSQIKERFTLLPQIDTVLQELSTGIKVIDSYDDDMICLNHIHEEDMQQDNGLSATSLKLMLKLKKRTSANDIPLTVINTLAAARLANGKLQKSKNQPGEWLSLFRSPLSTNAKRCSECYKEKLRYFNLPYLIDLGDKRPLSSGRSRYNQSAPNSARSATISSETAPKNTKYGIEQKGTNKNCTSGTISTSNLHKLRESTNTTQKSTLLSKLSINERPKIFYTTASAAVPSTSSQVCFKCEFPGIRNHVTNSGSYSEKSTKTNKPMSREINSEIRSVTRSIQCSTVEVPGPGDHVIYPRGWNDNTDENREIPNEDDDYSVHANASTISSSSSRYQDQTCNPDDLEDAFLKYLKSQRLPDEQRLASLDYLKRVVEKMDIHRDKPYTGTDNVKQIIGDEPSVKTPRRQEKSVESSSVCSKTIVYQTTPVKAYNEASSLDSYLVHRLSIPPSRNNSNNSLLEESDRVCCNRPSTKTFVNEHLLSGQPVAINTPENLKRKSQKPEFKYQEETYNKRENSRPMKKTINIGEVPKLIIKPKAPNQHPTRSSTHITRKCEEYSSTIDGSKRVVKLRRLEIRPNDPSSERRRDYCGPLMPAREPIVRARTHMYPTPYDSHKIVKETDDDEFDLTRRDFIEKFLNRGRNDD